MKIAIIGMAFRFPGDIHSEARFWEALRNAEDLVTTVDSTRWGTEFYQHPRRAEPGRSITFAAGQLSRIDEFDAQFFGISPREARQMDPQQRMLLELAWEALEDGGQLPERLAGSDCGVYVGISGLDYGGRVGDDISAIDAYFMTGNTLSIAANRLSYVFDLRGPSMAIDTACSSSLVALHQACQSLRNGESGMALAGGAHLLMHPYPFVGFTKAAMLSAAGRCRTFDAEGDGYVRAEGGAILVLKPLETALADGDHVHAVILASGVNTDGYKSGLTIPSPTAQAELMRACCSRAGVAPADIAYIEAHGTGTAVGDPIETAAIGAAIGQARSTPLYVGSVKSNLGHLEPASGMAGLVKTVLCLKERALPPSLHLKTPNPHIDFEALNLLPVTELTPLAGTTAPLCMGVNSFGFGGANAHVLLEEAPTGCRPEVRAATPPLFLSARHPEALKALAGRYADRLADGTAYYDLAHAAAHRRQRLDQGLAVTGADPAEVAGRLRQCAAGTTPRGCVREDRIGAPVRVAFIYSGNGAQWLGMGRRLLAGDTTFRTAVEEIDALLARHGDLSIAAELVAEPGASRLHLTEVAQPALFAVQVGVTRMLRARGLEAEAALGHSVGEVAAAWAMAALSLEQAVQVIHERSAAQAETQGAGRMAAVGLAAAEAEHAIAEAGLTAELAFAAYNSPGAVTLSGSLAALESLQAKLAPRGVFFRLLDLDYAFHSWHMDGLKPRILRDLANLAPTRGTGRFISTVAGTEIPGDQLDAAYWWRNIREPVQFAMAVNHLAEQGFQVLVEIGPHAIMQRYIADCLAAADRVGRVLATLKRDDDDADRIDETVCRAHLLGAEVDMKVWFPAPGRHVSLPGYPWQRERYWHASTSEGYALFDRVRSHPLLGYRLKDSEASWENQLDPELLPWLRDHVVGGAMVLPAAAYAELALAASARQYGGSRHDVEELEIRLPIVLEAEVARTLRFELDPRDGTFRITSRPRLSDEAWSVHAVGRLLGPVLAEMPTSELLADLGAPALTAARHYQLCRDLGLDYGPAFQGMQAAWLDGDDLITRIELPKAAGDDALLLHPALADACFQSLLGLRQEDEQRQTTYLPVRIGRLRLYRAGSRPSHCRTRMVRRGPHSLLAEFTLFDADGHAVARLEDCRFRAAQLAARTRTAEWVNCAELKPRQVLDSPLAASPVLARHVRAQLDLDADQLRRQHHFTEAMPLLDALIGVFARRALAAATPATPPQPYQDWLLGVAVEDGLAERTDDGWQLTETTPTAAADIWLTILADNPAYLPELAITGRIGSHLAEILAGQLDGQYLVAKLREGPLFEQLHEASPTFRAMNRGLRALLKQIVQDWPANRRLRILDLAPPCLPLVHQLLACLPADRCDYVIATDAGTRARADAEFGHLDGFACVELDRADWMLGDPTLPVFDVILANHSLHQAQAPVQVLANLKRHLARTGLLVIMERHPDRFATFIHGLHPDWWRPGGGALAEAETWCRHLAEAGYTDIETLCETQANPIHPGVGLLLARNPDLPETVARTTVAARWLLLASPAAWPFAEAVGGHLRSRGHTVDISAAGPLEPGRHDHVALFPDVNQGAESEPMAAQAGCLAALDLVQAIAETPGHKPRLWLLSAGGAGATSADGRRAFGRPNPSEATRWSFGRVVANEHPGLDCTRIDLQAPADLALAAKLAEELLDPDGEDEIILGPDSRHVSRMRRAEPARRSESSFANVRLGFTLPGRLKNLEWQEYRLAEPGEGEIEIQPRAAGLNFRDVMYAMGLLSDEAVENGFAGPSMGMEVAGIVSRVGAGVSEFKPGDAVIAFAPSGFARRAVTRATAAVAKPEHWSFE
ncbi:MAG: acyltransferase domain-containing protein, partial [Thiobacillus sp.]|nr:acyltransferase domain-containing protein [Thiobacillus sp.]